MPTGKRASMREGPLAALFRKTGEEAEAAARASSDAERAATSHVERPVPTSDVESASGATSGVDMPAAQSSHAEPLATPAQRQRDLPAPVVDRGPVARRDDGDRPDVRSREVPAAPESPAQLRVPSPQERLRNVFSADIPHNVLERPKAEPASAASATAEPARADAAPAPSTAVPSAPAAPVPPAALQPAPAAPVPPPGFHSAPVADVYARPERIAAGYSRPAALGKPVLRVVGVGGAGVNAVNRMIEAEIAGVEFLAINTDLQSLQQSAADQTLHIGERLTRGLGTGSDPELGGQAAREEYDRIKAMLRGSDMVFIAAGAGGGTGTGAAPIVAQIAREVGALTVAILTRPFQFEGSRRRAQAEAGIAAMESEVDTLIVVPNNRLLAVLHRNVSMVEAFRVADDVLRQGVQGIADLVTLPGLINLDFADVRTIMSGAGTSLLGIGMGTGERRAIDAAEAAVASPLLDTSMEGARSILLSITGGSDLSLWEVNEAAKAVAAAAHADANIIFGAMIDDNLDDTVWVTVVATGYGDAKPRRREPDRGRVSERPALREPWGEPRVSRAAPSDRARDFDVPEFMPRR